VKYDPTLTERICSLLAEGKHTIADVCEQVGISKDTFYRWKRDESDFSDSVKKASAQRLQAFAEMALSGLAKRLDVYEYEEVTTEYIDSKDKNGNSVPKIKTRKVTKKRAMPSDMLILATLQNQDSENWKDKRHHEHTGKDGAPLPTPEVRIYTSAPPLSNSEKEVDV